jgi:hypothetical protein
MTDWTVVFPKSGDPQVTDIDDSKLKKKDSWCKQYEDTISQTTYKTAHTYTLTVAQSFT